MATTMNTSEHTKTSLTGPRPVPSILVAEHFVNIRRDDGLDTTVDDLMNLLYLAHGFALGIFGTPLLDEPLEARSPGPMSPTVYGAFGYHGTDPIRHHVGSREPWLEDKTRTLLGMVDRVYRKLPPQARLHLVRGAPWHRAYSTGAVNVSNEAIREMFAEILPDAVRDAFE